MALDTMYDLEKVAKENTNMMPNPVVRSVFTITESIHNVSVKGSKKRKKSPVTSESKRLKPHQGDIESVKGCKWLSESAHRLMCTLVTELSPYKALTSCFWQALSQSAIRCVKGEMFLAERPFIPCCTGAHRWMIVLNPKNCQLVAYDSLFQSSGATNLDLIRVIKM